MNVFIYLAFLVALSSFIVGLTVLLKSPKTKVNRLFFGFTLVASFWSLLYSLIDQAKTPESASLINSISHLCAGLMVFLVYKFTSRISGIKKATSIEKIFSLCGFIVILLSASNLIAGTVMIVDGKQQFLYGPLYFVFVIYIFISLLFIVRNLKISKNELSQTRQQKHTIRNGLIISMTLGLTLGAILPAVFSGDTILDDFAPMALLYFIVVTAYTIVRHRLFDVKAIVARSVIYVISLASIVTAYVLFAFVIQRFLLSESSINIAQLIANAALAFILVVTYPYVKQRFDKITNRLFFRDAYDPQALIDKLNQTLVTNVQLESLLTKSALVLQENIKNDFCTFYIRETSYFPSRIIGAHRKDPEFVGMEELENCASKLHHRVHSVESGKEDEVETKLTKLLKKNQIEVMARLVTTLDYDVKGVGYIFMGQKKSGSLYTLQDLKIIEIIANELVIAIENVLRFEEIEQFNVTLQKKIDDATRELKESNEKLKALDEAKDEFVSMASHQLRTPLTSIKGYISMVLEGDAGKITDIQKQMLGQAFFSSQRMVYLISDLLNVSRLKTGKFVIEPKPVYLPDVVESEITQLNEGAIAKNLTLAFVKPKKFPTISLDEMKTRQVIMNFTDNALYYTPNGGKITIELKDKGKSIEFTVKDNGIGVPKAEQHKLFAKFYRAENARKARPDGTGLGLFMAQKVIIAQGGAIIFESKEGKGSIFGFSFPKAKLLVTETPQVQSK